MSAVTTKYSDPFKSYRARTVYVASWEPDGPKLVLLFRGNRRGVLATLVSILATKGTPGSFKLAKSTRKRKLSKPGNPRLLQLGLNGKALSITRPRFGRTRPTEGAVGELACLGWLPAQEAFPCGGRWR